nr:efflux RND transporter periplasmic adaptor subunit [Wenzhouxiangella sp. XN79A]
MCIAPPFSVAQDAPVVSVGTVESRQLAPTLSVTGTVQSRFDASLSAGVSGSLVWVAEPGTRIAEGDAVARLDARPFEHAVRELDAKMERNSIRIRRLEQDLRRYEQLHEQHSIAAREVDELAAELDIARTDLALLRVARDRARDELERTTIVAPFSGVVSERLQQRGEAISATQPVARLVSTDALEIKFHGPLQHSRLPGRTGSLDVTADGHAMALPVRATVPVSDSQSQSFVGFLEVPVDAAQRLQIGQLVRVALPTALPTGNPVVPRDALIIQAASDRPADQGPATHVFVLDDDDRAQAVPVSIVAEHGDRVGVSGALQTGQRVIVRGAETLQNGQRVQVLSAEQFPLSSARG